MDNQKIKCTSDNSSWMSSIERAYLKITSPSGKSIDITKHKMSQFSDEDRKLVWNCIDNEMIRNTALPIELTKDEMTRLLILSKIR